MLCPRCHREVRGRRERCLYCGATLIADEEPGGAPAAVPPEPAPLPESPGPRAEDLAACRCPRCGVDMVRADLQGLRISRCPECLGLWMDGPTFDFLIKRQAEIAAAAQTGPASPRDVQRGQPETRVAYLACPVCGRQMTRANYAKCSGVIFDQCLGHGVWLDDAELQQILAFIATGGHDLAVRLREEAEQRARLAALRATPVTHHAGGFMRPAGMFRWLNFD